MPEQRIRLLFVIGQLLQGGSERFLFEICSALDRSKFDVEILTYAHTPQDQHYARLLAQKGVTIHRLLPRGQYALQRYLPALFDNRSGRKAQLWLYALRVRLLLGRFFSHYDLINFIQIEMYTALQRAFRDEGSLITYLMSHRVQYAYDPYADCLPHRTHHFVLADPWQSQEIAGTMCGQAETAVVPLVLDFSDRESIELPELENEPVRIGIFSRLSPERPIEFFFHALQRLLKDIDATLHIYGRGDPQGLFPLLGRLGIRDRVIFMGHQADLEETIRRDKLSVIWMISIGAFIGYGSIEAAGAGVPIVFWSLRDVLPDEILAETGGAMHAFTEVNDFVAYNRTILREPAQRRKVGQQLREYVLERNDVRKHIASLEAYLIARASRHDAPDVAGEETVGRSNFRDEVASGQRFEFGKNWQRFLAVLNDERIAEAERSLREMLGMERLTGRTFLDLGSGSGLFSLAAKRLGATRVHSLDYDPQSVACTTELKRRYFAEAADWDIAQGSVLDESHLARLGQWDVVYSWGVLHHTGAMWRALTNVLPLVQDGGILFISIYNDQGYISRIWLAIKRFYNQHPLARAPMLLVFAAIWALRGLVADLAIRRRNPLHRYREYQQSRGMSYFRDLVDWLGGYPFEVAKPEQIIEFVQGNGFELLRLKTSGGGLGCNEFVFRKAVR